MAQWISGTVPSTGQIVFELEEKQRTHDRRRFARFRSAINQRLDDFDYPDAVAFCVWIPLIYLNAALYSTLLALGAEPTPADPTVAEVVGGIVAILFAIIVFSVQLHASRTDEAAFAVRYLVRTHRTFPILSFGLGVVFANVIAVLCNGLFPSASWHALPWLNLLFVPCVFVSALWLTWMTIQDATAPGFDSSMPMFRRDMRHALAENIRRARMNDATIQAVMATGFRWGYEYVSSEKRYRDFATSEDGIIVDVNVDAMKSLYAKTMSLVPGSTPHITAHIGQPSTYSPTLRVIVPIDAKDRATENTEAEVSVFGKLDESREQVQNLLDAAIQMKAPSSHLTKSLSQFLQRYGLYLRDLAQDRRAARLESTLERLEEIAVEWAVSAPTASIGTEPWLFRSVTDDFRGPLSVDLADALRTAIRTEDEETINAFLSFLDRIAMRAARQKLPILLQEICSLIRHAYYRISSQSVLGTFCTREFDETALHLLYQFESRHLVRPSGHSEESEPFEEERTCLGICLKTVLGMLQTAIKRNRVEDADRFMHRLFAHEEHTGPEEQLDAGAPTVESAHTLHDYLRIIVAGVCLASIRKSVDRKDAALAVLKKIPINRLSILRLIAVWELYHPRSSSQSAADYILGVEHWDPNEPDDIRAGVTYGGFVDSDWIVRGLHFLIVRARPPYPNEVTQYFHAPAKRHLWNEERSREWLEQAAKTDFLSIDEPKRDEQVDKAIGAIRYRQIGAELQYVETTIESPIDAPLRMRLAEESRRDLESKRHWIMALRDLCPAMPAYDATPIVRARTLQRLPREYFVPESDYHGSIGWFACEQLARREAIQTFVRCERYCKVSGTIAKLAHLRQEIDRVSIQLKAAGYSPNLVVIPHGMPFAAAIFQQPLWQVPDHRKYERASRGKWNDFTVLAWPYTDATHVLVADACELFRRAEPDSDLLSVELKDISQQRRDRLLALARGRAAAGEMPSSKKANVLVDSQLLCEIFALDFDAGCLIDVQRTDGSFALSPHNDLYHRITCPDIQHDDDLVIALAKRLPSEDRDRAPCPTCQPEKMDLEARMGKATS